MKRVVWMLVLLLSVSLSVHALSWAYAFVVLDGRVYEVTDIMVLEADLGDVVGEVETLADDMTGDYYGDASNMYPIGTEYRQVEGESVEDVLAVEDGTEWKRAEFVHEAPFDSRNHLDVIAYAAIGLGIAVFLGTRLRKRR
ncbi:hypothetical protein [Exiguobacterium sp. SH1S1]|uniref:hypothetical protein n=2 Tax=Exiguobacterium TaxID=33986 RepID=UPI00103E9B5A|nr:hypothetical protein [Exiguobacterium sp. SH1S1]TCI48086.1 hypothetical protein EVJ31_03350 [Exiguobacterium sp. SH5S32]TCI54970.1 hypothetical protein EVJ25_03345 [Exiguobacterium sp. SH1S4]TCI62981.1 hypothetical protein EVJ21_05560 [Exiguobacterium sp. SH0S2]TCI74765.1 hypothetical protein EVJ23_03340 [Exiguobacterium sp. SH1S1]